MFLNQLLAYLGRPNLIYKTYSAYNGEIKVFSLFGRRFISVDNLTQSGPIVEWLWRLALKEVKTASSCLVLGVAGGSVIKVLRQKFPSCQITGVEIDKKMTEIGNQYFNLNQHQAEIVIDDAFHFVKKNKKCYDLICIDLLIGRQTPKKLTKKSFFLNIKRLLTKNGLVIINTLRLKNQPENQKLIDLLTRLFSQVRVKRPLVNTLIFLRY